MKKIKILFMLTVLLISSCNSDKINQLENENVNLKRKVDSLNVLTADMTVTNHKILGKWLANKKWAGMNWDIEFSSMGKAYLHFKGKSWGSDYENKMSLDYQVDGSKIIVYTQDKVRGIQDLLFEFNGDTLTSNINFGYFQELYKLAKK